MPWLLFRYLILARERQAFKFYFSGWVKLTRVNPSDLWPDHYTWSTTESGLKTIFYALNGYPPPSWQLTTQETTTVVAIVKEVLRRSSVIKPRPVRWLETQPTWRLDQSRFVKRPASATTRARHNIFFLKNVRFKTH